MRFADRLKQVVASTFIEIERDGDASPTETQPAASAAAGIARPVPVAIAAPVMPSLPNGPYKNSVETTTAAAPAPAASVAQPAPAIQIPPPVVFSAPEKTAVVEKMPEPETRQETREIAPSRPDDAPHWLTRAVDGSLYTGVLGQDGTPDFSRLYANATDMPQVLCGAEQASEIVTSLPAELPLRVKRITAKATVDLWSRNNPAILEEILSDAAFKMVKIARLSEAVSGHTDDLQTSIEAEVIELERQITERRAQLIEVKRKREAALRACKVRMAALNDVVLFFDHNDTATRGGNAAPAPSEENELPPHLRDDSVMRLLGLSAEPVANGNGHSN